ncbi:MAG: hypothetical protein GXY83_38700 [Rhodopirellula sp.]|nr:hypothetical protein [Rhodopirellula sp.]
MGVGLFPAFEPQIDTADFADSDGSTLVINADRLDEIATAEGLKPFTGFYGNIPGGSLDEVENVEQLLNEDYVWHSSAEGLRSIAGLLRILEANATIARGLVDSEAVIEDLKSLYRCLVLASEKGAGFRLEVW